MSQWYLSDRAFQSLTLRDLLEARDRHHVRLATQYDNVVGTAVGFFRYREEDPADAGAQAAEAPGKPFATIGQDAETIAKKHAPRRMESSAVRKDSPPCILVFVDRWLTPEEFKAQPDKIIPSFLETNDARLVPTCIIFVEKDLAPPEASTHLNFPAHLYGGGYVTVTDVQEREHVGSVGCLVTDGNLTYALTNRHVTGTEGGRPIFTYIGGERTPIGRSHSRSVGKVPSATVYSKWPGQEAYANIDAGLIEVDNVYNWTTQVFGIGHLDEPFRINFDAALETCIGLPLRAFGGASGHLEGEIVGLFYRYKALGGYDYIADFLIGPRPGQQEKMRTLPGDSGTLWVLDKPQGSELRGARRAAPWYRPVALQWGGQVTLGAGRRERFNFALATSIESACRLLEVDVIRDWNIGHPEYWGELGHYAIGLKACGLISDSSKMLKDLMLKNSQHIGFDDTILRNPNLYQKQKAKYKDVPLADVPDNVWRNPTKYGGRSGTEDDPTANNDENNHFSDMDQPGVGKYAGTTLMDMYQTDPTTLNVDTWNEFYALLNEAGQKVNPGALPFRVWQAFNAMVEYLKKGDVAGFFCVAGIVAHYVGDSCQPLHISRLHHGFPPATKKSGAVHSVYETRMLDHHTDEVVDGLNTRLGKPAAKANPQFNNGEEAARGVVELMIATFNRLRPESIVQTFNQSADEDDAIENLWTQYKEETMDNMAACCTFLASLWESAWKVADAEEQIPAAQIHAFDYGKELRPTYKPETFFPSVSLANMKPYCY